MKKLLSILLAVLMVATLGVVNITADENDTGEMPEETPDVQVLASDDPTDVLVSTEEELRSAISVVKETGKKIVLKNKITLTKDIDFENVTVTTNAGVFTEIKEGGDDGKKMFIVSSDDIDIMNVTIECNYVTNYGILFYNCTNGSLTNVTIDQPNWHAVQLNGSTVTINGLKAIDQSGASISAVEYARGSGVERIPSIIAGSGNIAGSIFVDGSQVDLSNYPALRTELANLKYSNTGLSVVCRYGSSGTYTYQFIDAVAKVDGTVYATLQDAVDAAIIAQSKVVLIEDVSLKETVNIANDVTIDMNGYSIFGDDVRAIHVKKGDVKLVNSSEKPVHVSNAKNESLDEGSSVIRVGDGKVSSETKSDAKLYIGENVIVNTNDCYGVTVFGAETNETLVVDGQISTNGIPAIAGNGSVQYGGTNITINGTVSTLEDNAIYHPQAGTLTVNGYVRGKGGIEMKAGTVYFGENSRVIATAEETTHSAYSNGCSTSGYALSLVGNEDYLGNPTANINTGYFEGPIEIVVDNEVIAEKKASLSVSGGTFVANIPSNIAPGYAAYNTGKGIYKVGLDPNEVSVLFDYSYVEKDFDLALGNFAWQNFTFTRDGKELGHHYVTYSVSGEALTVNEYGYLDFTGKTGLVKVTATCGSKSASAYVYIVDSYETADEGAASSDEDNTSSTLNTESSAVIKSIVNNDSKAFEAKASLVDGVTYEELKNDVLSGKTVETVLDSNKVDTISNETTNAAVAAAESQLGGGAKVAGSYDIQVKLIVDGKQKANITSLDNAIQLQIDLPEEIRTVPSGYSREVAIVRLHDGVATVIAKGNVSDLGSTITCSSNLFSEYVLVYRDTLDYVYTKPAAKKPVVNTSVR